MLEKTEGTVQKLAGKAQSAIGEATGDAGTRLEGAARQLAGQTQQSYGQMLDYARDATTRAPIAALAVAVAVGFVLGALTTSRS